MRSAQEQLAASVPGGRLIVAERSGHRVDRDQPEVIVDTVIEVIRLSRTNR